MGNCKTFYFFIGCFESYLVLTRVWLFVTFWAVACQAPLSMGFFRREYWSGLPCPPPGDLPDPRVEPESPVSPVTAGGFFTCRAIRGALLMLLFSLGTTSRLFFYLLSLLQFRVEFLLLGTLFSEFKQMRIVMWPLPWSRPRAVSPHTFHHPREAPLSSFCLSPTSCSQWSIFVPSVESHSVWSFESECIWDSFLLCEFLVHFFFWLPSGTPTVGLMSYRKTQMNFLANPIFASWRTCGFFLVFSDHELSCCKHVGEKKVFAHTSVFSSIW